MHDYVAEAASMGVDRFTGIPVEGRTFKAVVAELNGLLKRLGWDGGHWGGLTIPLRDEEAVWPRRWRGVACFAMSGSNEGYIVNVAIRPHEGEEILVAHAKLWDMNEALLLAGRLTVMLPA